MTSCATFRKQPDVPTEAAICSAAALVDPVEYRLAVLETKSDKEFHIWAADMAEKYPNLFTSYSQLRGCWLKYHPEGATSDADRN